MALTTGELYPFLVHLLRHPGEAFSRTQRLRQVWAGSTATSPLSRSTSDACGRRSSPIPAAPQRIATVWGVGYRRDAHPPLLPRCSPPVPADGPSMP
ncbi:MAG: winged helix-turn-helix domain-containing protein [Tetrasphaera sp.]|nr:winged helix-turn-helix domain-containing protein [Tetrasphaera sp.]